MTGPTVLAATWSDGVFVPAGETRQQELAAQLVYGLKPGSHRGALAIIDGHSIANATPRARGAQLQPTIVLSPV